MAYNYRYFRPFVGTQQTIGSGAITNEKIAPNAVTSDKIKDGEVTSADIKDGTIKLEDLGPDIPAINIVDGSITEAKLANDSVSDAKLKTGSVVGSKIGAGAVTVTKLANDAVETVKIKDAQVTAAKAAAGFGRYVPRKAVAEDKVKADFTLDNAWHIDGLDLSAIIPAGAIGVVLQMKIISDTVGDVLIVGNDSVAYPVCEGRAEACVADTVLVKHIVLPCEANRLFDYVGYGFAGVADVWVTVLGWFI